MRERYVCRLFSHTAPRSIPITSFAPTWLYSYPIFSYAVIQGLVHPERPACIGWIQEAGEGALSLLSREACLKIRSFIYPRVGCNNHALNLACFRWNWNRSFSNQIARMIPRYNRNCSTSCAPATCMVSHVVDNSLHINVPS